ncbi:hypothetical protein SCUP515_01604 [Seiridium cupressi]
MSQSKNMPFEETAKISRDYAMTAIRTLADLCQKKDEGLLRFIYISGYFALAENMILEFAGQSHGNVESAVAKPGLIHSPERERRNTPGLPHVELHDIAAALLDQVVNGSEKDALSIDGITRIGQEVLAGL